MTTALLTREQLLYYVSKGSSGEYASVADTFANSLVISSIEYLKRGMYNIYKIIVTNLKFLVPNTMIAKQGSQILFHSIFDIYKEDLGILSQVTEKNNWHTRTQ